MFDSSATLHITQWETLVIFVITSNHWSYSGQNWKNGEWLEDITEVKEEMEGENQREADNGILSLVQELNSEIHKEPKTEEEQWDGENCMLKIFVKYY